LIAALAAGRFVIYLVWVSAADTAAESLRDLATPRLGGPAAMLAQVIGFVVIVLLMRLDWARLLRRWLTRSRCR
jgi:hypothetical protein